MDDVREQAVTDVADAPLESRREDWEAAMNEVDSDVGTQGSGRKA